MTMYDHPVPATATGGCIRFTEDGPQIHHNDVHVTAGIRELSIDERGRLLILHSAPGAIITMFANADETLVSRGISFGCSGGVGKTIVQAADRDGPLNLRKAADYKRVAGPYSNIWLFWLHAA